MLRPPTEKETTPLLLLLLLLLFKDVMSYRDGRDQEEESGGEEEEDLPQVVYDLSRASVPALMKGIRACKRCGLLKTLEQFEDKGCENCGFLEMQGSFERVNSCTTAFFEGQVAIMDPGDSWAAKWIRVDNYLPGVYAISVMGSFDKDMEDYLESRGIRWRCRPP